MVGNEFRTTSPGGGFLRRKLHLGNASQSYFQFHIELHTFNWKIKHFFFFFSPLERSKLDASSIIRYICFEKKKIKTYTYMRRAIKMDPLSFVPSLCTKYLVISDCISLVAITEITRHLALEARSVRADVSLLSPLFASRPFVEARFDPICKASYAN